MTKEDKAIVLDFLAYGYPLEKKTMPVVQAIGTTGFTLLELVPRRGVKFEVGEEVYIGEGPRDKVQFIAGRLHREKLTETAKLQIEEVVAKAVKENEKKFVDFYNNAQAMNTRLHQLEILPGLGKKHAHAILQARSEKPFESFEDIRDRVHNLPDPEKVIEKRIVEELTEIQKHNLFTE